MASAQRSSQPGACSPDEVLPRQRGFGIIFRIYKAFVSPVIHAIAPSRCLYLPTCSEYAYIAMSRFGVVQGSWLALRRFGRCHPWGKGGFDPVPGRASASDRLAMRQSHSNDADHLP
jgi:putative membrane protein insertion efficiency factor